MLSVPDLFIWFQKDFFKHRQKLNSFFEFCYFAKKSYGSLWDPKVWALGIVGPDGIPGYGCLGILGL